MTGGPVRLIARQRGAVINQARQHGGQPAADHLSFGGGQPRLL